MHPVLGTMMPEICEAPHLPTSRFHPSCHSELKEWGGVHLILSLLAIVSVDYSGVIIHLTDHRPSNILNKHQSSNRYNTDETCPLKGVSEDGPTKVSG